MLLEKGKITLKRLFVRHASCVLSIMMSQMVGSTSMYDIPPVPSVLPNLYASLTLASLRSFALQR